MQTKRLTLLAMYTAIALALSVIETLLPVPTPVPGVRLGLANVVTLAALLFFSKKEAGMILFARITLGSFFTGGLSTWLFSAAGGLLAFPVMAFTLKFLPKNQIWVTSVLGALAHNAAQLTVAALYMRTPAIFAYSPVLIISAILTGIFTGLTAQHLLRYEKWLKP